MSKTIEIIRRVWNDDDGVCIEVRPDQDGLDMIELHTPDNKSREHYGEVRFAMDKEMARKVGEALIAAASEQPE